MKIHEIVANNFNAIFEPKIQKELCDYGILKHAQPDQINRRCPVGHQHHSDDID